MNLSLIQSKTHRESGITLVEVMISLAIISVLLSTIITLLVQSGRLYTRQNVAAGLQQEIRTALEIIVQASRMATFQSIGSKDVARIKVAETSHFRFQADRDANGILADAYNHDGDCENVTFRFSRPNNTIQMICGEGTPSMNTQVLLGGTTTKVTDLSFEYFDDNNNPITAIKDIRGAVVNIVAQASAGGDGLIERRYTTRINFRNTGPNMKNKTK